MLLSTAYLPNIQYIDKFCRGARPRIEACENFQKQTFRNRCRIMTANGVLDLTVPVVWDHRQKMPIRDVLIDNSAAWQRTHWRAIVAAYKSSPYFDHYGHLLEPFFVRRYESLWQLNNELLAVILKIFKIPVELEFTEVYEPIVVDDFRNLISPKVDFGVTDPDFVAPSYYQVFSDRHPFASNLSIIDYLFCNGVPL